MGSRCYGHFGPIWDVPGISLGAPVKTSFGPFTLDEDRHQLFGDGRELHLSLKAFELLRLLLNERPRVLSKAELHRRLWPDAFVSDATLTSVIAELRSALGERARQSRFIRTVHGFGYAFAGDATEEATSPAALPAPAAPLHWIEYGERQFPLREGENVLGRDRRAAICLTSSAISRHHARIVVRDADVTLEDLGSRNGTFARSTRVTTRIALQDGDQIRLGAVRLTFRSLAVPGSTTTHSS